MKEDLLDKRFVEIEEDMNQQIQALRKAINIQNRSDKLQYDGIR